MKCSISKSALMNALAIVGKGIAAGSTLPVLSGIYIKATENGEMQFQTTDLTIAIRHTCPAAVDEPGDVVLSGKLLQNIVKTLSDAPVVFESQDNIVYLSCDKSNFLLNTISGGEFPIFPEYTFDTQPIELPRELLSEMVDKVYRVTSRDNSRPILSGILLTIENNTIRLVATDSFRLAVCDTNIETSNIDGSFEIIVPGSVFHDVLNVPTESSVISIGLTDSQIVFTFGNTTYVSRKIEGHYPNYKQLLPTVCTTTVNFSIPEFNSALKRVSIMGQSSRSVKMEIEAEASLVKLSTTSNDLGESSEIVPAEIEGTDLSILLNYNYIFDCINAVNDQKTISLELIEPLKPSVFKSYGKIRYLYLLMPVRPQK